MMQPFCGYIGLMRFFWRVKPTKNFLNAVGANPRAPTTAMFLFRHAQKAASFIAAMRASLILVVTRRRNITQILKSVVARVAVNVIYGAGRPLTGHVKPRQTAVAIANALDADDFVAVGVAVPRNCANYNFAARFYFPSKNSRCWVVIQHVLQLFNSNLAHAASIP